VTVGESREFVFSVALSLNGSEALYLGPFARETTVQLTSNSQDPSFQGNWLPVEHTISEEGFEASWRVSYLGRNYPQAWISTEAVEQAIDASRFGVSMLSPVDQYRMAERSVKYAGLFILLTFALMWLSEILAGARVHPIQYLMLGAALCVFYLLELSLAEHIGFRLAYGLASLAILAMVGSYARSIFRSRWWSALVSTGVALLYGFLFVLLTNEDAALLVGSIGVFLALAVIMFVTRRVDWYTGAAAAPED
jgi:inner membrane protein